jgi:hypothetical protein
MFGEGTTGGSSSEGDFSVTAQQEHLENQVLKMSLHVENARKMCALAQQKSREAKEDVTKPHSERSEALFCHGLLSEPWSPSLWR